MDVKVRKAKISDIEKISEIEKQCFPIKEAATYLEFKERLETFPNSFFVATYEEEVVGFINGCVCDYDVIFDELYHDASYHKESALYQCVFGLDVLPTYQHQGIAHVLMHHFIRDAKRKNRKAIILTCKKQMIPFYESFGYVCKGVSNSTHGNVEWYDMILFV